MSVSSVSLNSDTTGRYQRLAAEYAKLRSQAKVLREGVLTERSKAEKLTEELKSREAQIRKIEAENESLSFRNDQLVKRVENLQVEIEQKQENPKQKSKKSAGIPKDVQNQIQSMSMKIELLEGELRNKLRQNEELVIQISENERLHSEEMAQISEKFAKEYRILESELKEVKKAKTVRIEAKTYSSAEFTNPFDEESEKEIEISSPEPPESIDEAELLVADSLKNVFEDLHNCTHLLHQRTEIYPFDITMERLPKHVEKLSCEYTQCARLFHDCVEVMDNSQSGTELELKSKIDLIAKHCNNLLISLVNLMCNEENKVSWCTAPLEELNKQWADLLVSFFSKFSILYTAITNSELVGELEVFSTIAGNLFEVNQKRFAIESRLPTTTKRMRCISLTLKDALEKLTNDAIKLHARSSRVVRMKNEDDAIKVAEKPAQVVNSNLFEDSEEETKTPEPIKLEKPKTVIEKPILRHVATSPHPTPEKEQILEEEGCSRCETLTEELSNVERKLGEVQNEKDKQNLDFSLLKRKFELANGNQKYNMSDIDHLRDIGMQKQKELVGNVMNAEKKAKVYEKECKMLLTLQICAENEKQELLDRFSELSKQKMEIEDELNSVRRGYEAQIGELSNHVATLMNEKTSSEEGPATPKLRTGIKSFFK